MNEEMSNQINDTTVPLSTRVKSIDKDDFVKISKELDIPQHELFKSMVETLRKMHALDGVVPGRQAQAEELQGLFKRMVDIYSDVLTSNENLRETLVGQHMRELGQKEKEIRELRDHNEENDKFIAQMKKDIKAADNEVLLMNKRILEFKDSEEKSKEIIGGMKRIESELQGKIGSLNDIITENKRRDLAIEKECEEIGLTVPQLITEYKALQNKFEKVNNDLDTLGEKLKDKENLINSQGHEIKSKSLEIDNFKKQIDFFTNEIDGIKKEYKESVTLLKIEYKQEISELKAAHKADLEEARINIRNEIVSHYEGILKGRDEQISELKGLFDTLKR